MAWVEDEPWEMEQGLDASKIFELFEDDEQTQPWQFVGWDINASIIDQKGRKVFDVTVNAYPLNGRVILILPEASVNSLKTDYPYSYDCLMIPPGSNQADDHFLAAGPVQVSIRGTRRDP